MSGSPETATSSLSTRIPDAVVAHLHREAGAERFGLSIDAFAAILRDIAAKYLPASASPDEASEWVTHLHLEDLALSRACAAGNEFAWETFLIRYREKLFTAAYSIVKSDANARELADSLYADLYGTRTADGARNSKLNSYTGRGSLEGWLRAVLAQEYVNRFRRDQRNVSLEEKTDAGVQFESPTADPGEALDPRLVAATDEALASLAKEDKFILANYYLDDRTLAETARLLGVHESTVSRKVEKITVSLRKAILAGLKKRGMSKKDAEQAMEIKVEQLSVDVRKQLLQENGSESVPR
jgi:RNA polymerase sigma-70 factor (ECF subfamily)